MLHSDGFSLYHKRLTAGKFTLSYLRLNYLWHASQNIYYPHALAHTPTLIHTYTGTLSGSTLVCHDSITWNIALQTAGGPELNNTNSEPLQDEEWLWWPRWEYDIIRPEDMLVIHLTPGTQWPSNWYASISLSVSIFLDWCCDFISSRVRLAIIAFLRWVCERHSWDHLTSSWVMPLWFASHTECHAQGDRCGVHGYNVNVLSPWRQSIALSQRGQRHNGKSSF